jgi:hypothetical protein
MQYGKLCLFTMLEMQMLFNPHVRLLLALLKTVSHALKIMVRKSLTSFQFFYSCYCIGVELVCLSLTGASSLMIYTSSFFKFKVISECYLPAIATVSVVS